MNISSPITTLNLKLSVPTKKTTLQALLLFFHCVIIVTLIIIAIIDHDETSIIRRVYYSTKDVDLKDIQFNTMKTNNNVAVAHSFITILDPGIFTPEFHIDSSILKQKPSLDYTTVLPLKDVASKQFAYYSHTNTSSSGRTVNLGHCMYKSVPRNTDASVFKDLESDIQTKIEELANDKRYTFVLDENMQSRCIRNSPPAAMTFTYSKWPFYIPFSAMNPYILMLLCEMLFASSHVYNIIQLNNWENKKQLRNGLYAVMIIFNLAFFVGVCIHAGFKWGTGSDILIVILTFVGVLVGKSENDHREDLLSAASRITAQSDLQQQKLL
jgi:hypothetical protein